LSLSEAFIIARILLGGVGFFEGL